MRVALVPFVRERMADLTEQVVEEGIGAQAPDLGLESSRHSRRWTASMATVLSLRDLEEMSTDETAGVPGLTPNAVKVRHHCARQALRTVLDPIFP